MAIPIEVRVPTKITDGLSSGVLGYNKDTQQWSLQPAVGAVNGPAVPQAVFTISEAPGDPANVTNPSPVLLLMVQHDETPFAIGGVNTQFNSGSEGSGWGMYQANSGAFILGVGSKNMTMVSAAGTTDFTTDVGANGFRIKNPVVFASLPATPAKGQMAYITDCNSTTFHAVAAGGGTNNILVVFDGTSWRVGG